MRQLASIQRIVALEKIENADAIEKATVLGWQLVVKKNEFKTGELCVYCEIDSILPEKPEFEFLRERKFRIKTIKLRGQISQGICFPLSILPGGNYKEDDDVTEIIGVKKYDQQAVAEQKLFAEKAAIHKNRLDKFMKRYSWYRKIFIRLDRLPFPQFIKKTDEDRIQLFPDICEREKDTVFQVTEKIDGSSGTYFLIKNPKKWQFWKKYLFGVCSRNFQLLIPDNSCYWYIAKKLKIKSILMKLLNTYNSEYIILQGEIIGLKIQGNKYSLSNIDFYVFNFKTDSLFADNKALLNICTLHGLKCVPIIENEFKLLPSIPEMVEYSKGKSTIGDIMREGVVIRNYEKNISFKVVNPDFLLKYSE